MKNEVKKIWIDLDNSPHVLFFNPIIRELKKHGIVVAVTVRDHSQVCGLADLHHLDYKTIGRHYGKNPLMKIAGLIIRAVQLIPFLISTKPDIALSHGSRSQFLISTLIRLPFIYASDYEHAKHQPFFHPAMIVLPEVLPKPVYKIKNQAIARYPGIKEDVYVPDFMPDDRIKDDLGLNKNHIIATVRPPAMDAHYQNPESGSLFKNVINFLGNQANIRIVMLPRVDRQAAFIRNEWADLFANGKMIIPEHVVNGLNLIWHSDLVLSGGGTIIREAAALNVPAYSFFRGKIGAVDKYLTETGKLMMIQNTDDIKNKILVQKRPFSSKQENGNKETLQYIVKHIVDMLEGLSSKTVTGSSITHSNIRMPKRS